MTVTYHPAVQQDVSRILRRYDQINGFLGDEFWNELTFFIAKAAANPQRFHFEGGNRRRVNLKRFHTIFSFEKSPMAFALSLFVITGSIRHMALNGTKTTGSHTPSQGI